MNQALLDGINASGRAFLTHTRLDGDLVLRLAIGGVYTEEVHVQRVWDRLVVEAARH